MKLKVLSLLLCLLLLLAGCGKEQEIIPPLTTEPTVPAPTTPADGNPNDVTCQGSYYVADDEIAAVKDTVVATMEDKTLTNGQLQVYYWLEVAAYRQAGHEIEPDFAQSLDTQPCGIDDSVGSWQQYFLREALNAWQAQQALVLMAELEGVPTEAAYKPDLEKRAEYMTGMPATEYLYAWSESYKPNRLHQDYWDQLPDTLEVLAADNGFGDNGVQAKAIAGAGADSDDLTAYAQLSNMAYMYFTEMGYHFEPTAEEIEAYYQAHQSEITAGGEKTVDFRHILLIPEGAEVAANGTVTADENAWARCLTEANNLVTKWLKAVDSTRKAQFTTASVPEVRFSEFAKNYSQDPGSNINGGLYVDIHQSQLAPELDTWLFDAARQHGDYEIIRSNAGCHILFFSQATEDWYAAAEAGLIQSLYNELIAGAMAKYPAAIDYAAIKLGQAEDNGSFVTPDHLLYPDVAHERFPDMPLYLQQDYPDAPFGDYLVSTHGCGITTLAMVASYLADDELTPPELAARFGYYCGKRGSEIYMFDDTPAEMGFQLQKRSYSWAEMDEALKNGQVVVSLQWVGYWTRGGHYIAMIELTDEGRYVVRDSNLLNYQRVQKHAEDNHSRGSISEAGQYYWIYEKKVTTIPTCVRCGEEGAAAAPQIMFTSDYHCAKCLTAMERRNDFLESLAG